MNEAINQTVMRVCHYTKTIFYKLLCPNAHFPCPGPVQSHASREIICYSRIKKLSKNGSYNAEMNCATRFIVKSFHHCSIFNKKKKNIYYAIYLRRHNNIFLSIKFVILNYNRLICARHYTFAYRAAAVCV